MWWSKERDSIGLQLNGWNRFLVEYMELTSAGKGKAFPMESLLEQFANKTKLDEEDGAIRSGVSSLPHLH